MSTKDVDDILKVRLDLGQIMKFTYYPLARSNVDWFNVDIMSKTSALMHGNVS